MSNITVELTASPSLVKLVEDLIAAVVQRSTPFIPAETTPIHPAVTAAPYSTPAMPATTIPALAPAQIYTPAPVSAPAMTAPVAAAPTYALEDLARAAGALNDIGVPIVTTIFPQFGIHQLRDLGPEQYGAFATALRQMGAKI